MIHNNSSLPKAKRELSNNELHIAQGRGGGGKVESGSSTYNCGQPRGTCIPLAPLSCPLLPAPPIRICSTQSPPPSTDRGSRAQLIQFRWQTRFRFCAQCKRCLNLAALKHLVDFRAVGEGGIFQGDGAGRCRCQARNE